MKKRKSLYLVLIAALGIFLVLTGCPSSGSSDPDDPLPGDTTAPTVSATVPAADAVDVAINSAVTATFSEDMTSATVIAGFSLGGATGAVTYDAASKTATFTPTANLSSSTLYTATISTGALDAAGNALAAAKVWSFTTGVAADTTAPTVLSTVPVADATGVAITANITATFSEAMSASTVISSFTVAGVAGTVTYDAVTMVATFNPTSNLTNLTAYTATISVGAKDLANNALAAAKVWSFTTAAAVADTIAPTVASTIPAQSAVAVAVSDNITATFSEEMDLATMVGANFTVWKGIDAVLGAVTFDQVSKTITFNPDANLISAGADGPVYTARITTVAQDLAGNNLLQDKVWTFTPGSGTRVAVDLLTAGDFVILAQDTITTTGVTAINGDLGVGPAADSFITGFAKTYHDATDAVVAVGAARYARSSFVSGIGVWPTVGSGKIFSVDYLGDAGLTKTKVDTAVADRITAYNAAGLQVNPDVLDAGGGTLNGLTFAPGLYKWGTAVTIPGNITLSGTATDVWIFQVASNLGLGNGMQIILSGGALPENVFWQVGGITTLGTTSVFKGIILGASSIVMQTGSTLDGRALSFTAVTLDAATVNQP